MSKTLSFEQSMTELETIIKQLEQGELTLDEALNFYEKGVKLARTCQETLTKAEQKIEILRQEASPAEDNNDL